MQEKIYDVTGMTCASCAAHAQKAASKLDGVEICDVNIATEKMRIRFDESKVDFAHLQRAVEAAGYGLIDNQNTKNIELDILGMSCASCSAAVERAVKKLDGVKSVSVNLATNRGRFVYDPAVLKLSQIKTAITNAGYAAKEIETGGARDAEQERRNRNISQMRMRLIVAAVFSLPELYIAMSHMIPKLGLPLPAFMSSHDFPLIFAVIQFALTIPVIFAGSRFFTVGFKVLFKGGPNMDTLVAIGTGSAFLYSTFAMIQIYFGDFSFAKSLYFESAAVVITLVMLGKYLEAVSRGKNLGGDQKAHESCAENRRDR